MALANYSAAVRPAERVSLALLLLGTGLVWPTLLDADPLKFQTLDVPTYVDARGVELSGVGHTGLAAINNLGLIVGNISGTFITSFTYSSGSFSILKLPGIPDQDFLTVNLGATGINDPGVIVGNTGLFAFPRRGSWIYNGSNLAPGPNFLYGINDAETIVGAEFLDPARGTQAGFVDSGGIATLILGAGGYQVFSVTGVNNVGQILLSTSGGAGYLDTDGTLRAGLQNIPNPPTFIAVPGASSTSLNGINDALEIVGSYQNATGSHGFLYSRGEFIPIDVPGASSTVANGLNNLGEVVGAYTDAGGTHGFVTTVLPQKIRSIASGLSYPAGIAVDATGNVYVADTINSRILKIAAVTGVITTVAGNGQFGFAGDGGLATDAIVNGPWGVAVDSGGNLYIADTGNSRIRKVAAGTGVITTVAGNGADGFSGDGGPAASAGLNHPVGIAVDAAGNLYIADVFNQRIRKVSGGVISTIAGNGVAGFSGDGGPATSASLNYPFGVAVDGAGNVYIADSYNHRIRKLAAATGVISTVTGNGAGGFSGDEGLAADGVLDYPFGVAVDSGGNIYVADSFNSRIRRITAGSGRIATVAGIGGQSFSGDEGRATDAGLDTPYAVAVDSAGNLYIADTGNQMIRKVASLSSGQGN